MNYGQNVKVQVYNDVRISEHAMGRFIAYVLFMPYFPEWYVLSYGLDILRT